MSVAVRRAGPADVARLLPLFAEMEQHYEGAAAVDEATLAGRLARNMPRGRDAAMLLAESGGSPVGLATLFHLFPGRSAGTMGWLKELYVARAARGRGVGRALMQTCAAAVTARGGLWLDWSTGADNAAARSFYDGIGARTLDAVRYRAEGAALAALAAAAPAMAPPAGDPDADLDAMDAESLRAELRRARAAIREHREATGHDLCWFQPDLWALLPEGLPPHIAVPDWPQFLRGCVAYRASLDRQAPGAPRTMAEFDGDAPPGR